ncbi:hypothetical protein [Enterococcus hirae]|uniref:hypothetical protein n=1 Tax=Enterococcus hirae TaxID=1354 RepID=UPI00136A47FB|nr:hypothetical protein [Enterococcus hirae]NAE18013.1 hypothetical protein [Enterococcus hirae]
MPSDLTADQPTTTSPETRGAPIMEVTPSCVRLIRETDDPDSRVVEREWPVPAGADLTAGVRLVVDGHGQLAPQFVVPVMIS